MNNYAVPEGLYANEEFVQENKCVLLSELFRCAFGIYSKYFDRLLSNNVNLDEAALRSSLSRVSIVCCQYITLLNLKIEEPSFYTEIVEM